MMTIKPVKEIIIGIMFCILLSCNQQGTDTRILQSRIDSLQKKLDNSYKPGLGEFMSGIQIHHAKLWFAGTAGNWGLSDFETKEIQEAIDDIQIYCTDRPEVASISMIKPALDSINEAIKNKSISQFKSSFNLLTNTCNNCHRITKHEFNVIQIPNTPPFTNQRFQSPEK
jgi:hypothetical protein